MWGCCVYGDCSRMNLPFRFFVEVHPHSLINFNSRSPGKKVSIQGAARVDWGHSLTSPVTVPSSSGHCISRSLSLLSIDHVWLNSEACFIFWISCTTGFLPTDHLPGLCLAKEVSAEPHSYYKMWLKYFIESSALGTTNSFQQMSANALNKDAKWK